MTTKNITEKMKEIIKKERVFILSINLPNYDAICESYILEVLKNPFGYDSLTEELWIKMQKLKTRNYSTTPPSLANIKNETTDAYIERCYRKGGYFAL